MARPIKYFTEEARKRAIQQSKNKYLSNTDWYCHTCGHNYKLNGKWNHLQTKNTKSTIKQCKIDNNKKQNQLITKNEIYFWLLTF